MKEARDVDIPTKWRDISSEMKWKEEGMLVKIKIC